MEQLSAIDNMFVQQESPRAPLHISPVMIYDQSALASPLRFKEILSSFERNLPKSKIFRRKLYHPTGGLDLPYWVDDEHFDLEFHVRHLALPAPGDWRQFCILLARLHSREVDMRRPLWEAYVIEKLDNIAGLPKGSFAIMFKIHHAAIDGVSGAEIVAAIHSLSPEREVEEETAEWQPADKPAAAAVWARAALNSARLPAKFLRTATELTSGFIKASKLVGTEGAPKPPRLRTRFNARVSAHRATDAVLMDLAEVKAIKNAVPGTTVNDVMVSVVGGGLRKYLQAKNELPATTLVCGAPISVRSDSDRQSAGNQVNMMTISLATDIEDPLQRLMAVHCSATDSKAYSSAVGASALMDVTQSLAPRLLGLGMRAALFAALRTDLQMPFQTMVSNVPGPQVPLYLCGARLQATLGMGPILDNMGLFHAVLSGPGGICINFVACRDMLPDPAFYADCLQEAYQELKAATIGKNAKRKLRARKK